MTAHLTNEQLNAYAQRRLAADDLLTPDDLQAIDAHLFACAACRQRAETALPASAMALYADWQSETESPAHLSFEQLSGRLDDTLNHADALVVGDHLASCMQCAHALEDLRKFAATDAVIDVPPRSVVEHKASWWERMRDWAAAPALGWTVAALLLIALAGWLMRALWQRPVNAPQVVRQSATPSPLPVLSPSPGAAPLLAQLNDGGQAITLDQQGKLSGLESLSPAHQQLVKDALTSQRLPRAEGLNDLNRRGSSLMGADEAGNRFALQAPVGKVVLSDRPTFKWSPLKDATSYVVEIYDEQFNLVAQSETLTQNQFTPPRPLARGKVYGWQVKAVKDGQTITAPAPPAPQARFRVIASNQAEEISQAKRAGSSVTLALLYAQGGLLDEAEAELRALRQANPNAEAVRRWQAQAASRSTPNKK